MVDVAKADDTIRDLEATLATILDLKTQERSEEQRRIAILATKVENSLAWAKYTFESTI